MRDYKIAEINSYRVTGGLEGPQLFKSMSEAREHVAIARLKDAFDNYEGGAGFDHDEAMDSDQLVNFLLAHKDLVAGVIGSVE